MKISCCFRNSLLLSAMSLFLVAHADEPIVQVDGSGWDIYTAVDNNDYNYGPSIIVNNDGSIDAWFSADGSTYTNALDAVMTFNLASKESAVHRSFIGQRVTLDREFRNIQVYCPTWNNNGTEDFTMKVYRWDTNLSTTLAAGPIYTHRYENFDDNSWLKAYYSTAAETDTTIMFPAGSYLWTLTEPSSNAGVWTSAANPDFPTENFTSTSGKKMQNAYRAIVCYNERVTFNNTFLFWDQAVYRRSTDGGVTWTDARPALQPTYGSRDHYSVCDPGAAKWGGYYYVGYTSTQNTGGVDNHLYMARSKNVDGPWEKWNGTGWGGNPQPVVTYTGRSTQWGVGEPSIVVKGDTVYLYYSWNDDSYTTHLSIAPASDELWPAKLENKGLVIDKGTQNGSDHCDVKYVDALNCFVAFHSSQRFTSNAYVQYWTSEDGIHFTNQGKLTGPTVECLHNVGVSGDSIGHVNVNVPQYIGYGYGSTWSHWNTRFHKLKYAGASGLDRNMADSQRVSVNGHTIELSSAADVELVNVTGMLVACQKSVTALSVDSPGVYLLRYRNGDGSIGAKKIVVR